MRTNKQTESLDKHAQKSSAPKIYPTKLISFFYLCNVIRQKIISTFLLCLLFLVNWHNTFAHSHIEAEQKDFVGVIHSHPGHDHSHPGHRHQKEDLSFLHWLQQLLGDFEHPDFGDQHFELFLKSNAQDGLVAVFPIIQPFLLSPPGIHLMSKATPPQNSLSIAVLSFTDPPFLEANTARGPPQFS